MNYKRITILVVLIIPFFSITNAQTWDDNMVGIDSLYNSSGSSIIIYDFYNKGDSVLFIGGAFEYINESIAFGICKWNPNSISTLQEGVEIGGVYSAICFLDTLYIGGTFISASENPDTRGLAIWNGTNWQGTRIGGFSTSVEDFCIYNGMLIVGGRFTQIGDEVFYKIAAYDGENWINIGHMGTWVSALTVFNGDLYAGGYFGLRKYLGGTEWEDFAIEPNDFIFALETDTINSFMYVGGQFSSVGGQVSMGSAMWDGFNWLPLGDFCGATVWHQAMEIYRGDLYTGGGLYYNEDEEYRTFITKWNGESWDSIGGAFSDNIFALEIFRDTLYIGGCFETWSPVYPEVRQRNNGMVKLYIPDNGCDYLKPRINTYADTFYLNGGEVDVNLYNNNPYVDSWEWNFGDSQTGDVKDPVHTYTQTGEYNVQVTVTDGECVKTANKTIYIELGNEVPQFEQINMQVHPNPSSNDFTVKVTLPNYNNAEIKIAGLNGHLRSVIPVTGETTIIQTKGWKAGVYVCNLFIEGKLVKVEKLVFE
jgi:hypothetical protein